MEHRILVAKQTKTQQRRESAYRRQLKRCGYRSWKRANRRRATLIEFSFHHEASVDELAELERLQTLADLYVKWKTNDLLGRQARRLKTQGSGTREQD
jgi:hypothetical protein